MRVSAIIEIDPEPPRDPRPARDQGDPPPVPPSTTTPQAEPKPKNCRSRHSWWVAPPDALPTGVGVLPAVCVRCWRVRSFPRSQPDNVSRDTWNSLPLHRRPS